MLSYVKLLVKLLLTQHKHVNLLLKPHFLKAVREGGERVKVRPGLQEIRQEAFAVPGGRCGYSELLAQEVHGRLTVRPRLDGMLEAV